MMVQSDFEDHIQDSDFEINDAPVWKSYLYRLQLNAPKANRLVCLRNIDNKPPHYGREYHGTVSRDESDMFLRGGGDGCYLVRESQRQQGCYTLALRFGNAMKNFKLYYDGKHYIGEKRFDTLQDLVTDGLITMHIENYAGDYIAAMSSEPVYEKLSSIRKSCKVSRDHIDRPPSNELLHTQEQQSVQQSVPRDTGASSYAKDHHFKVTNLKGLHWCQYCGNFMWGLVSQGVKCLDCGLVAHKQCSKLIPNDCQPDMKHVKQVFGVDLTTITKAHNTRIPIVVDICINELESRGLDSEGLYRVSGFSNDIDLIRSKFETDSSNVKCHMSNVDDINTISGVLKLYFRLLPIPLITFQSYPLFIQAARCDVEKDRVNSLRESIQSLPAAHYHTLKVLISHLQRVSNQWEENLMTADNLGVVFGPTLLRSPEGETLSSLVELPLQRLAVEKMILLHATLFQ